MVQSIIVYSFLFVFMLICFTIAAQKKSYVQTAAGNIKMRSFWHIELLLPILAFAVIFGLRFDVGTDYLSYLNGYIGQFAVGKGEVLFTGFTHLFQNIGVHYTIYFGVIALIQAFFFFYAFKREQFILPFLVFFLFMNGSYMFWMNGVRQAIALCIWVYALNYIEKRDPWKYFLWCLVAIGFHWSAIELLIFYPLLRKGKDYFTNISLQLALLVAAFVIQQIFMSLMDYLVPLLQFYQSIIAENQYSYSLESLSHNLGEIQGSGLGYLFRILLNATIVLYSKKLKEFYNNKWFTIVYFFFFIGVITLYIFPTGAIVLTRPFRYFYLFQTIMYAYFAYYLLKSRGSNKNMVLINRAIFCGLIIAFLGIFYLNLITTSPDSHLWYQFYFQMT